MASWRYAATGRLAAYCGAADSVTSLAFARINALVAHIRAHA